MTVSQSKTQNYRLRLDIAVTVVIIAILITFLLGRFHQMQADIEKDNINTQLQHFKLGITEAWISAHIQHKTLDLAALEHSNPMLWLAEPPKNYIGALAKTPQVEKAVWYFDTDKKELIYVMQNGELMRYVFTKANQNTSPLNGGLDLILVN